MAVEGPKVSELIPQVEDGARVRERIRAFTARRARQSGLAAGSQNDVVHRNSWVTTHLFIEVMQHPRTDDAVDECGESPSRVGERGVRDDFQNRLILSIGFGPVRRYRTGDDRVPEVVGVQMNRPRVCLGDAARDRRLARSRRTGQDNNAGCHRPLPVATQPRTARKGLSVGSGGPMGRHP